VHDGTVTVAAHDAQRKHAQVAAGVRAGAAAALRARLPDERGSPRLRASGPEPSLDLPAMDASMLDSDSSAFCKQPTHVGGSAADDSGGLPRQRSEVGTDRTSELERTQRHLACLSHLGVSDPEVTHSKSTASDGESATDLAAGEVDATGLIFT
jgi:hypothetical protein